MSVPTGGLPRVEAYDLPAEGEWAGQGLAWTVDPRRVALLVHDVQSYFVDIFPSDVSPMDRVLAHIRALRDRCDARGIPVFHTAQPGHQDLRDRGLQADYWGPGMPDDPERVRIVPELTPGPGHTVLTKWRYSAFQRTPFGEMLAARGRDQLIITGVYAHIGCQLTAADAFMRDIQPFFVADAVADFRRDYHVDALRYVARTCGRVVTTHRLMEDL